MMDDEQAIDELLDTIGDREARRILTLINPEPRSAKEIGEELDLSLPTVYRRLDLLQEHDLVESRTLVAENGNHYKVFEANFTSTVIALEGDEFNIQIYRQEELPDRFSSLWDALGGR